MATLKLKGAALYVSVIISILISIILSLFITVAYYNTRSVQAQNCLMQLHLSLESGFEMAESDYYKPDVGNTWQKMPYNNDSVTVKKLSWGCFILVDVKAKNSHFNLHKTGLFGSPASTDTALMVIEQNRPIGLAGKIKFNGSCYFPKAGIKSTYIEGASFSDLNSVKPYVKASPNYIPDLDEGYLKAIDEIQSGINPYTDSLISFIPEVLDQSFRNNTAVVKQGNITLSNVMFSDNIKLIASDIITVENSCVLNNILLVARKVIFKQGFKGTVHVIAKDTIITEDGCEFNYPSSFCVYSAHTPYTVTLKVRGIFFGLKCKFKGGLLAANNKEQTSQMMIKTNEQFELVGNAYSSNYANAQGNLYGTLICKTFLLQTPSGVYENHLLNCLVDPKRYGAHLTVPCWLSQKEKRYSCAIWF